jgi:hypothetical protein
VDNRWQRGRGQGWKSWREKVAGRVG